MRKRRMFRIVLPAIVEDFKNILNLSMVGTHMFSLNNNCLNVS